MSQVLIVRSRKSIQYTNIPTKNVLDQIYPYCLQTTNLFRLNTESDK